jgi:type III pantothenate kinase
MDFATELKNHLTKEENLLDSIIASQKQVRLFVTKRDWLSLENEMKILEEKANNFMTLEDERNQFVENAKMILIGKGTKTGIALKVDNPNEIGNDLIADLVGAKEKYGYPALVVDLGTASKILLLDKDGYFASALIMPGLKLSIQSLVQKASLLPAISLEIPESILAKNTVEAMNAGVVFGHIDMILGLIKRIESEIGYECKHILTGGYSLPLIELLKNHFIYDMNLNLDGLNIIIDKNGGNK